MPTPQCPECGRFLRVQFAEAIHTEPAPCPGCGEVLWFGEGQPPDADPDEVTEPVVETPPTAASGGADSDHDTASDDGRNEPTAEVGGSPELEEDDRPTLERDDARELEGKDQPALVGDDTPELEGDDTPALEAAHAQPALEPPDDAATDDGQTTTDEDAREQVPLTGSTSAASSHPLDDWDTGTTTVVEVPAPDPRELVAAAALGGVLGAALGGRGHRVLGAWLGVLLGAAVIRLRS